MIGRLTKVNAFGVDIGFGEKLQQIDQEVTDAVKVKELSPATGDADFAALQRALHKGIADANRTVLLAI
ncbi:hypothetical protein GCM10028783_27110 [Modestobacter muralis]